MVSSLDRYYTSNAYIREAIKTLRANIQFASVEEPVKTLMLTSTFPNEGKTTTSIYLAISLAETGKRVLLIDGDLRRPMIGEYINDRQEKGLVDYIAGTAQITDLIIPTKCENLFFLDSGPKVGNTVEILSSERFEGLIEDLRAEFDYVIVDTPPLGSFIEAAIVASVVDGTILVVENGKVEVRMAKSVVEQLKKANARVLGIAYSGVDPRTDSYYGSYYGNYYYYSKKNKGSRSKSKGFDDLFRK